MSIQKALERYSLSWMSALLKGYSFLFFYVIVTAVSFIYIDIRVESSSAVINALYTFILAAVFFHLLNYRKIHHIYKSVYLYRFNFILINIATVLLWLSNFIALAYITPIIIITLSISVMPVFTLLLSFPIKTLLTQQLFSFMLALAIILLGALIVSLFKKDLALIPFIIGIILSVISGIGGAIYMVYSKKCFLYLNASQILAVRFHLLIIVSLLIAIFFHGTLFDKNIHIYQVIVLALLTAILPMYLLQKGLLLTTPFKATCFISLTPLATYILQIIIYKEAINWFIIGVVIIMASLMMAYSRLKQN